MLFYSSLDCTGTQAGLPTRISECQMSQIRHCTQQQKFYFGSLALFGIVFQTQHKIFQFGSVTQFCLQFYINRWLRGATIKRLCVWLLKFNDSFVAICPLSLSVTEFWKLLLTDWLRHENITTKDCFSQDKVQMVPSKVWHFLPLLAVKHIKLGIL